MDSDQGVYLSPWPSSRLRVTTVTPCSLLIASRGQTEHPGPYIKFMTDKKTQSMYIEGDSTARIIDVGFMTFFWDNKEKKERGCLHHYVISSRLLKTGLALTSDVGSTVQAWYRQQPESAKVHYLSRLILPSNYIWISAAVSPSGVVYY